MRDPFRRRLATPHLRPGRRRSRPDVEAMEPRLVLSLALPQTGGPEGGLPAGADVRGGGTTVGPAIRLDLVALHELGHALGLDHSSDPNSIMYAYYNSNYDITKLASDSVIPTLLNIYSDINTSPWNNPRDANPNDSTVEITYSFVPDGTRMDSGGQSTMFATFDRLYGSTTAWESIFAADLQRWADVSGGKLAFVQVGDNGAAFNASGLVEDDPNFGDIRIGAHGFDGPANVLAHTYFPPPNGVTAAGDSHYDTAENWDGLATSTGGGGGGGGGGNGHGHGRPLVFAAAGGTTTQASPAVVLVIVPNSDGASLLSGRRAAPVAAPQANAPAALPPGGEYVGQASAGLPIAPPSWATRGDRIATPRPADAPPPATTEVSPAVEATPSDAPGRADPPAVPAADPFLRAIEELYVPATDPTPADSAPEGVPPPVVAPPLRAPMDEPEESEPIGVADDPLLAATVVGIGAYVAYHAQAVEPRRRGPSLS